MVCDLVSMKFGRFNNLSMKYGVLFVEGSGGEQNRKIVIRLLFC